MAEGENEKELVGGLDVPVYLTNVENSLATLVRQFAQLKGSIGHIPIAFDVTHGVGEQMQQAVDQATAKARFNWKAIARPEELESALQSVQPQLAMLAAQAEKANSAIRMAVTGAGGTYSATIASQQDVAGAIEALRTHGAAIGGGRDVRAQMGLEFTPDQAGLAAAADVSGAMSRADALSRARHEAKGETADQMRAAIKDTQAEQGRTTFSVYGSPQQIQQQLAAMLPQFQAGEDAARLGGQRLSYSLAGPRGSGYSISQGLDVAGFIQSISQYAHQQSSFTAKLSMPSLGREEDARVQSHLDILSTRTRAEEAASRQTRKVAEEGERLSKWLELWATGGRPQRAIGTMLQGMLTPMIGAEGGAAMSGLGGMVGGGMLFHVGWEIINQLGKIPQRINEQIQLYRQYEMARAGMMIPTSDAAQAMTKWDPKASLSSEQMLDAVSSAYGAYAQRVRGGGKEPLQEFHTQLANLQRTGIDVSTPEKAQYWLRRNAQNLAMSTVLSEMNPTAFPKAYDFAYALQQMEVTKGAEGRSALASNQALLPVFTAAFRKKFEWLTNADETIVRKAVTDALSKPETMGLTGIPTPGAIGHKDAMKAVEEYVAGPQMVNMMRQRMATQTWSEWWNQVHMVYDPRGELTSRQARVLQGTGEYLRGKYTGPLTEDQRREEEMRLGSNLFANDASGWDVFVPGRAKAKLDRARQQARELLPMAEAYSGIDPMAPLGLRGDKFKAPDIAGNANFSFSSFAEFARKMQIEAGVNLQDPAERTAKATESMVTKLDEIKTAISPSSSAPTKAPRSITFETPPPINVAGPT